MNTKLKCLLLDDELTALSYTKLLCEEIPGVEVVKAFNDPLKFINTMHELDFNTCILDIQMPGLTGLEVAGHLKDKLVIFTTAYKEFAADAFDLNAVDYIRKPLQKERFGTAISRAFLALENKLLPVPAQVLWSTDQGKTMINTDDIFYISSSEIDSRDKIVFVRDGRRFTVKNTNFGQIMATLPQQKFCRINKKEIIALDTVQNFSANQITSSVEGRVFSLSDIYRELFLAAFVPVKKRPSAKH
ncbi:MAG: response regulator [Bacteroidota bacterium]